MKKQIIHFRWRFGLDWVSACGAEFSQGELADVKITLKRDRVTCKRCKNTKTFRKIK